MARSSEEISKYNTTGGKPDTNLANDALHLNGIPGDQYATQKYVQDYHGAKEELLKEYIDEKDALKLQQAKSYTDIAISNLDFSNFVELKDIQALDEKLSEEIVVGLNNQKNYTDQKVQALANDVNANFDDVGQALSTLNNTTSQLSSSVSELFTSVSNGKRQVAAAITDQGVPTASNASFSTMATNIRRIPTGGGEPDPYYINTGDADAVANDIMLGKTAYVKGEKIYGLHVDTGVDTSDATATPYDILEGKTAYSQGQKITGILNMSGTTPTYAGSGGIEKIYGGSSRDYKVGNINVGDNFNDVLYDSASDSIIATIYLDNSDLILKYIYGNGIGMTRTISLSTLISDWQNQILAYDDYSSQTFHVEYIGVTRVNVKTPFICLYSHYDNSERVVSLIPIVETRTPYNGATIITWELDTSNKIDRVLTKEYVGNHNTSLPGYVYEDGTRVLINGGATPGNNYYDSTIININNDNWDVTSSYNYYLVVDPGGYVRTIQTPQKIIPCVSNEILFCEAEDNIYALFFDANGRPQQYVNTGLSAGYWSKTTITSDTKYAISHYITNTYITIYSMTFDLLNYTISKNEIATFDIGQSLASYTGSNYYFISSNNLLILSKSNGENYIYSFTPTESVPLTLLRNGKYYVGLGRYLLTSSQYSSSKVIADTLLVTNYTNYNELRYINAIRDYQDLVALKYNGVYYYPLTGGVMTAGQGDVRKGKSFIGWMGYEEIGTMEV